MVLRNLILCLELLKALLDLLHDCISASFILFILIIVVADNEKLIAEGFDRHGLSFIEIFLDLIKEVVIILPSNFNFNVIVTMVVLAIHNVINVKCRGLEIPLSIIFLASNAHGLDGDRSHANKCK